MAKNQKKQKQETINQETFEKLCGIWCTLSEIAGFFDVCEDTIETWCKNTYNQNFSDIYKKKSAKGNISLRRMQYVSAQKGNVTMQIWLGKQKLGQTENVIIENPELSKVEELLNKIDEEANK